METRIWSLAAAGEATLDDLLAHWRAQTPAADAAIERGRRLSYAQLHDAVAHAAGALTAAGVCAGDRIAMLDRPGIDFWVTFLATARVGAIWVGLNPRHTTDELDHVLAQIEPRLVLARADIEGRSYREWLRAVGVGAVCLEGALEEVLSTVALPACAGDGDIRRGAAADPCLIVFTSGSTGAPKGVVVTQGALVGASVVQAEIWAAAPLRVLNNLPINHIGCVGDLSTYALAGGGAIVFSPRFDPADSLDLIEREAVTVWGQVPTMFQLTLDSPHFSRETLRSLQLVFWGGATATPALIDRLAALGKPLATSYGQTETVGSIAFTPADAPFALLARSVGRVVAPYELRIANVETASDEGEIEIRSPFAMVGYWRDGVVTPAPWRDGWRSTGDVGRLSPAGDIELVGRVHDVFKSGGYNIYPAEIEAVLETHPSVRRAAVVGAPDPLFGQAATAFLEMDGAAPGEPDLYAFTAARLANYKRPKRYIVVERLPLLAVGKVDKKALLHLAGRT